MSSKWDEKENISNSKYLQFLLFSSIKCHWKELKQSSEKKIIGRLLVANLWDRHTWMKFKYYSISRNFKKWKSEKKPIVNDDSFLSNICKSTIFKWKIFLFIFMNIQLIKFNGWQTLVNQITYKCIEHGSNYLKILIKEFLLFFFFLVQKWSEKMWKKNDS